jgi:hypothetical protein
MDVKQYYRKVQEIESGLQDNCPILVSLETPDGGKAGVLSAVPRAVAAKMIVEGRAVVASPAQKQQFADQLQTAKRAAEKAELSRRVQVAIISDSDLNAPSTLRKASDNPGIGK